MYLRRRANSHDFFMYVKFKGRFLALDSYASHRWQLKISEITAFSNQ